MDSHNKIFKAGDQVALEFAPASVYTFVEYTEDHLESVLKDDLGWLTIASECVVPADV